MYEVRTALSDSTPDGITRVDTTQFWINNAGLIVRKVIEQDFAGDRRFMRSVANYSYKNIRIEEPTLPVRAEDK